ncbi:MAG: hypothetical protein ABR874_00650 [Candidatus Sulfotelmatobacter sp.]|jgi:hypothetical protein
MSGLADWQAEKSPVGAPAHFLFPQSSRRRRGAEHAAMNAADKNNILSKLEQAHRDLDQLAASSGSVVEAATQAFKILAGQTERILKQAANIVERIAQESMGAVLGKVRELCLTVRDFLERRLEGATTVLGTLGKEETQLRQLTSVTHRQEGVAHHLRALSVFTNIEVAHLGRTGGDFKLLAEELSAFSRSLSEQTLELSADTKNRENEVEETRAALAASLPKLRGELVRMEEDITEAQRVIESDLSQQADVPVRFRTGVEQTEQEIAGVVAAIQAHDITRQQIEHVQHSLHLIAAKISNATTAEDNQLSIASAGLTIQACQLKNIKATVENWASQIQRCMTGIRQLSASEVINVGPVVLRQERELSSQLAEIEVLQQKSQEYGGRMQATLAGLSSMATLVEGHLRQSRAIRDRLQLLMFNSLIEANRLGRRGVVVSAIANLIRGVSEQWTSITEQSQRTLDEMMELVQQTNKVMEVFSETSQSSLREDQAETDAALNKVRNAAALVAAEAAKMRTITEEMQRSLAEIGDAESQLEGCFTHLDSAAAEVEEAIHALEANHAAMENLDIAETERLFSSYYTTEIEREVMHAALHGSPLPVLQQSFTGNSVELF